MDPDSIPDDAVDANLSTPQSDSALLIAEPALEAPRKPRVWTVFVVFLISMVLYTTVSGVCIALGAVATAARQIENSSEFSDAVQTALADPRVLLASFVGAGVVIFLIPVIAASLSSVPWRTRLNLRQPRMSILSWTVAVIGVLCAGEIHTGLSGLKLIPDSPALEAIGSTLTGVHGVWLLVGFLAVGIMPGITEELLFRGYIQTRLAARWPASVAIIISAILFGVMHLDPVQGLLATGIGVYLGYLAVWTRSILPAMVCHSCNNSIYVRLAYFHSELEGPQSDMGNYILIGVSGTILLAAICYLRNHRVRQIA